ncbi:unnamed protein product [Arctia plantaginis]|uniref:Uncharacterized protein n=1 Tax=Arctia plantaginis TaxID=874455 RepID=A0A8S1B657_ARCPL|nr:unnamed protein product [Arctia plantaginis]
MPLTPKDEGTSKRGASTGWRGGSPVDDHITDVHWKDPRNSGQYKRYRLQENAGHRGLKDNSATGPSETIAEIMNDCIMGLDFTKNHDCKINVSDEVFKCGDQEIFILGSATGIVTCLRRKLGCHLIEKRSETMGLIEDAPLKTEAWNCMTARTLVK